MIRRFFIKSLIWDNDFIITLIIIYNILYIGIICVQGFKDYHCYILLLYYIYMYIIGSM